MLNVSASVPTAALVAEFNRLAALTGAKPVARFADRATAEKRVAALQAKVAEHESAIAAAPAPAENVTPAEAAAGDRFLQGGESSAPAPKGSLRAALAEKAVGAPNPVPAGKGRAADYVRGKCPKCGAESDITCGRVVERNGKQDIVSEHEATCHSCGHEFNYDTGRALKARASASAALAASWADPEIRADRLARVGCTVVGHGDFPSVAKAFAALNLPMGRHIRTRMEMKHAGRAEAHGFVFLRKD
jgi:hypothetical protein